MFIVKFFGSKRLAATVGTIIAVLLVPLINSKLGLSLDSTTVAEVIGAILTAGLSYVASQWHLDIKTGGATSASSLLKAITEPVEPKLPPELASAVSVIAGLAKPGSALADALKSVANPPAPPAPPASPAV